MDSQFAFASRDELWRVQHEMKSLHNVQSEHSERLSRLERRQDDDTRIKSVWGGSASPFPSVLNGTPQQDPGYNPAAEAFKNFDQDQNSNLLGSLHLDTEEEPRRGASRANSVRFDESALHGHFGHTSRSSSEFFPIRTGSAAGSHAMTERSSSHKSDGRQSSAGHSTHSTRLNSLGFDSRPPGLGTVAAIDPPPGLFLLGPLPSIIRCWLDTKFSNDTLLYAAVCTGSYNSLLSLRLVKQLGLLNQIETTDGVRGIKLQVYLPEATVEHSSVRAASPAPQLPALTVEFQVFELTEDSESESIQVFLGSNLLRAKNADILFSQSRMTIFDGDRNKLAIPLVRPENTALFKHLVTTNVSSNSTGPNNGSRASAADTLPSTLDFGSTRLDERGDLVQAIPDMPGKKTQPQILGSMGAVAAPKETDSALGTGHSSLSIQPQDSSLDARNLANGQLSTPTTKPEQSSNIMSSWRRDSGQGQRPDSTFSSVASGAGYQRSGHSKGMKILKSTRSSTSRSTSAAQTPTNFDGMSPRYSETPSQEEQSPVPKPSNSQSGQSRKLSSEDSKTTTQPAENKPRSANPVGGGSAFGWLNSCQ